MRKPSVLFPFALVLGLVGLWRGLQLYNDHMTRLGEGRGLPAPSPAAAPDANPGEAALPPPTAEEIRKLSDPDATRREFAIYTLAARQMTPELQEAVERAGADPANAFLQHKLDCLKARYPGDAGLDFALARVPKNRDEYDQAAIVDDLACLVRAVAERATERPDDLFPILYEAAFSVRHPIHEEGLKGLRRLAPHEIPNEVRIDASPEADRGLRELAVPIAFALGAIESDSDIVLNALADDRLRSVAKHELVEAHGAAAPRLLAQAVIRQRLGTASALAQASDTSLVREKVQGGIAAREDNFLNAVLREREQKHHDVSSALVEAALDEARPLLERQTALEVLTAEGDPGAAPLLTPLRSSSNPALKAYAEAAIAGLDGRLAAGGRRRQLPTLTP